MIAHPGRKLFHLLGGLGLLGVWFALGRPLALYAFAAILGGALAFDLARFLSPPFNAWTMNRMAFLLRPGEARGLNGAVSYVAGVALTLLLFPPPAAVAAVLFLAAGDVAATTAGEAFGRHRVRGKSLEGTAAFFLAAAAAGFAARAFLHAPPPGAILAGAWFAALIELLLPRFANDNLVIPLASALAMTVLSPAH